MKNRILIVFAFLAILVMPHYDALATVDDGTVEILQTLTGEHNDAVFVVNTMGKISPDYKCDVRVNKIDILDIPPTQNIGRDVCFRQNGKYHKVEIKELSIIATKAQIDKTIKNIRDRYPVLSVCRHKKNMEEATDISLTRNIGNDVCSMQIRKYSINHEYL